MTVLQGIFCYLNFCSYCSNVERKLSKLVKCRCVSLPNSGFCAGTCVYVGAVLAGDTGAEVVKQAVLPLYPDAAVAAVVCLQGTASHDP